MWVIYEGANFYFMNLMVENIVSNDSSLFLVFN
jgi:hypothetical protein